MVILTYSLISYMYNKENTSNVVNYNFVLFV